MWRISGWTIESSWTRRTISRSLNRRCMSCLCRPCKQRLLKLIPLLRRQGRRQIRRPRIDRVHRLQQLLLQHVERLLHAGRLVEDGEDGLVHGGEADGAGRRLAVAVGERELELRLPAGAVFVAVEGGLNLKLLCGWGSSTQI